MARAGTPSPHPVQPPRPQPRRPRRRPGHERAGPTRRRQPRAQRPRRMAGLGPGHDNPTAAPRKARPVRAFRRSRGQPPGQPAAGPPPARRHRPARRPPGPRRHGSRPVKRERRPGARPPRPGAPAVRRTNVQRPGSRNAGQGREAMEGREEARLPPGQPRPGPASRPPSRALVRVRACATGGGGARAGPAVFLRGGPLPLFSRPCRLLTCVWEGLGAMAKRGSFAGPAAKFPPLPQFSAP